MHKTAFTATLCTNNTDSSACGLCEEAARIAHRTEQLLAWSRGFAGCAELYDYTQKQT